jgi:uncharacterized membrane protein
LLILKSTKTPQAMAKIKNSQYNSKDHPKLVLGRSIRIGILSEIQKDKPDFGINDAISMDELNIYRQRYLENKLKDESGTLSTLEKQVVDSISGKELISDYVEETIDRNFSFGQRLADKIATFGGSWTFILIFLGFILIWMIINIVFLFNKGYDPYPFILLNLILSCLAALQAPVIMMSQNRQEEKDRERAKNDYLVNLKSELEIRVMHEKIDHLMQVQQEYMFEVQEIQVDMIKDVMNEISTLRQSFENKAS